LRDLTWAEVLVRLAAAAALGGVIGAERELRDHEGGVRAHTMVGRLEVVVGAWVCLPRASTGPQRAQWTD
jgi:uncharacterized membrane protein YhiD involved in acid resistance